ncbi:holotricin-3-like [Macrobrachium nipponense]|uniref:holotricin-3-like n=1 Tax=Macrobrachium nipponense TaxID=159736 RepID=UPI0030C88652
MKILIAHLLVAIVFAKPKPSAEPHPGRGHDIELLGGLDFSHGSTGLNTGYDGGHGGQSDPMNGRGHAGGEEGEGLSGLSQGHQHLHGKRSANPAPGYIPGGLGYGGFLGGGLDSLEDNLNLRRGLERMGVGKSIMDMFAGLDLGDASGYGPGLGGGSFSDEYLTYEDYLNGRKFHGRKPKKG